MSRSKKSASKRTAVVRYRKRVDRRRAKGQHGESRTSRETYKQRARQLREEDV